MNLEKNDGTRPFSSSSCACDTDDACLHASDMGLWNTLSASPSSTTQGIKGKELSLVPVVVIVGHYGTGKTNLALNIAIRAAQRGIATTLVDLDVVNPYFRSSEQADLLSEQGIDLVAPVFAQAGGSLDSPSLTGAIEPAIERAQEIFFSKKKTSSALTILDVGGDDVGATALGRFAQVISRAPYAMLYVVNRYRNLTQDPQEARDILLAIEQASHLKATALVNNSHLKEETDEELIRCALSFGEATAAQVGLPLAFTTAPKCIVGRENTGIPSFEGTQTYLPVQIYIRTPWE